MIERSIRRFLIELGVDPHSIVSERGWVNSPCPMAPYMHRTGQDERPSFGVRINDEGISHYYCFGCTPEGRGLHWLLHNFFIMDGAYPHDAAKVFANEEIISEEDEFDIAEFKDHFLNLLEDDKKAEIKPIPYKVLNQYPLLQIAEGPGVQKANDYLKGRRIPLWTAHLLKVRVDPEYGNLIFPLTDVEGNIFTLRVRSISEKRMWTVSPEVAGYPDLKFSDIKRTGAMFGLWQVSMRKPLLTVEGELDALMSIAYGFHNTVASSTSSISNAQIDSLQSKNMKLGFDADKAGGFATRRVKDRVGKKAMLERLDWSIIPKEGSEDGCKDPCDILIQEDFDLVLNNPIRIK